MHDATNFPGSEPPSGAPRWAIEQIAALGPKPESFAAAQPLAVPARWSATGCNEQGVWGRCSGSSSEPYDTVVDHANVAFACTCPSRITPCKHALALLVLWSRGQIGATTAASSASQWLAKQMAAAASRATAAQPAASPAGAAAPSASPAAEPATGADGAPAAPPPPDSSSSRDDRVARMMVGLTELDRWLDDRVRTGLADPSLARYATWDALAARLVDAQVGGLANRVRRLAGVVGASPDWHEQLLAEIGLLHLLAEAGRHLGSLPPALGDSVAAAIGWQVRQADVLAGVPETDHWHVAGRSDIREDRIEVRRVWLRGRATERWAMVLSFAAYGSRLDDSLIVGSEVHADVFRYPGALGLRSIVGRRYDDAVNEAQPTLPLPLVAQPCVVATVQGACNEVGTALAVEPWIDRFPVTLRAAPARRGGAWLLADHTGSVPISPAATDITSLLACSGGAAVTITAEWTPRGFVPLALHLSDRTIDIGPVADPSFLAQAAG